jgi:hypothetical protein
MTVVKEIESYTHYERDPYESEGMWDRERQEFIPNPRSSHRVTETREVYYIECPRCRSRQVRPLNTDAAYKAAQRVANDYRRRFIESYAPPPGPEPVAPGCGKQLMPALILFAAAGLLLIFGLFLGVIGARGIGLVTILIAFCCGAASLVLFAQALRNDPAADAAFREADLAYRLARKRQEAQAEQARKALMDDAQLHALEQAVSEAEESVRNGPFQFACRKCLFQFAHTAAEFPGMIANCDRYLHTSG